MNRIAIAPSELTTSASSTGIKNKHEWLTRARRIADPQTDLPFSTFAPIHYEERYAYPLLVWLHGDAGNEQELKQIMPLVSMSRRSRLPENIDALSIHFTPEEMNALNTHFAPGAIVGGTYLQR